MNDYEAHLSSYDHSHKQRLRDMKAMVRDPGASSRARKAEAKADGLVSIKLTAGQEAGAGGGAAGAAGGGFKKGGFKKSGFKNAFAPPAADAPAAAGPAPDAAAKPASLVGAAAESDTEDEGYEMYDPRYPTD